MTRQTTHKYTTRPSPPYKANVLANRNTKRQGNDGRMYVSKKVGHSRSYRWVPMTGWSEKVKRNSRTSRSRKSRKPRKTNCLAGRRGSRCRRSRSRIRR